MNKHKNNGRAALTVLTALPMGTTQGVANDLAEDFEQATADVVSAHISALWSVAVSYLGKRFDDRYRFSFSVKEGLDYRTTISLSYTCHSGVEHKRLMCFQAIPRKPGYDLFVVEKEGKNQSCLGQQILHAEQTATLWMDHLFTKNFCTKLEECVGQRLPPKGKICACG